MVAERRYLCSESPSAPEKLSMFSPYLFFICVSIDPLKPDSWGPEHEYRELCRKFVSSVIVTTYKNKTGSCSCV